MKILKMEVLLDPHLRWEIVKAAGPHKGSMCATFNVFMRCCRAFRDQWKTAVWREFYMPKLLLVCSNPNDPLKSIGLAYWVYLVLPARRLTIAAPASWAYSARPAIELRLDWLGTVEGSTTVKLHGVEIEYELSETGKHVVRLGTLIGATRQQSDLEVMSWPKWDDMLLFPERNEDQPEKEIF